MKKLFLIIVIISAVIISCSSKDIEKSQLYLLHDIWALNSLGGEKVTIDENIKNLPMLEIYVEEEIVRGNTGCNALEGKLDIDNNKIKFLNLVISKTACPGNTEEKFLSALQKVNRYKIEKMRLYLYEDDEELMTLKKID